MALNENPAMSPSSSVHCGQDDTIYATIGCVLRKVFADDRISGVHRDPACILLLTLAGFVPTTSQYAALALSHLFTREIETDVQVQHLYKLKG